MVNKHIPNNVTVAMLGTLPPLRGISSYCYELTREMSNVCTVDFLSFKRLYPSFIYPGGNLKDDHTFPDLTHKRLSIKRKLAWYNPVSWMIAGLFTKANVLHAQWWSLPLWPVYFIICLGFKLRGIPVIFTVHNVLPHNSFQAYLGFTRFLFNFVDTFIVHTADNVDQLSSAYGISEHRIFHIPHGTLDFHINKSSPMSDNRQDIGLDAHHKVILYFGAIRPYKGLDTLIRSLPEIIKHIPETRLLIAGKLWEPWQPYQTLIEQLELTDAVVSILDYIPSGDVYRYFNASDMVVLPYHHFDSQSGVGATAIAFRKPLIVTNTGGLPDLVSDSRHIVPPKDKDALAAAITDCLSHPDRLQEMASSASRISENLSWSGIAKKTLDVYHTALSAS